MGQSITAVFPNIGPHQQPHRHGGLPLTTRNHKPIRTSVFPGDERLRPQDRSIFNLVSNWYSNRHWYHLIGLCRILQVGKQRKRRDFVEYIYKMSVDENGTPIDRPQFTGRLEKEVGRLVRLGKGITLESLRYDENNDAIIRVLKLLNVQETINDNTEEKRFAFHLFEIFNVTSLEHIHPQNITSDIGFEDFRMWFERRSEDFYKLDDAELRALLQNDISNNPDSETMDMDWRIAEKKQEVEKAISVLKYLTSDKKIFSDDYNQNELDRSAESGNCRPPPIFTAGSSMSSMWRRCATSFWRATIMRMAAAGLSAWTGRCRCRLRWYRGEPTGFGCNMERRGERAC